jgi:hypothetical protein
MIQVMAMYGKYGASLVAALVMAGCSGEPDTAQRPLEARRDTVAPAPAPHAMHDSAGADSAAGTATMDHSGMGHATGDGTAAAGTDHSAHGGTGTSSNPAPGADHAAHGGSAGRAVAGTAHASGHGRASTGGVRHAANHSAGSSAGHAGMNHTPTGTSTKAAHAGHTAQSGGTSHPGMSHTRESVTSSAHGSHVAAGGQTHAATHAAGGAVDAHAGMDHGASAHAMPTTARPTDEGTRKLLDLAGELVRDPAVQREIQQDPALREAWSDPAVRRVVTKQP